MKTKTRKAKTKPKPVEYDFRVTKTEAGHSGRLPPGAAEALADWILKSLKND